LSSTHYEKILPGLYRVEVPLPNNPLKATNAFIIKSARRNLIIDTGMNRKECMSAISEALDDLEIDLNFTDFFITHLHADHLGLITSLATENSCVYFNRLDAEAVDIGGYWSKIREYARYYGFPETELESAIDRHPGNRYSQKGSIDWKIVGEGDTVSIGDYNFTCVETPGHTWGHTCLYEQNKKLFFSGDHILVDITPNISSYDAIGNPLDKYLESLDKVYQLDIDLVLPGHRSVITDCRARINELKEHHDRRLKEVLQILKREGPLNGYNTASMMEWDIIAQSWDHFPVTQKWFATGEALAHLHYLVEKKLVGKRITENKVIEFFLS
jgi:glyoxylase-like metal-dependent hydrolase (beta-lactamase superfamily II)